MLGITSETAFRGAAITRVLTPRDAVVDVAVEAAAAAEVAVEMTTATVLSMLLAGTRTRTGNSPMINKGLPMTLALAAAQAVGATWGHAWDVDFTANKR